jgi:hypothetical protein
MNDTNAPRNHETRKQMKAQMQKKGQKCASTRAAATFTDDEVDVVNRVNTADKLTFTTEHRSDPVYEDRFTLRKNPSVSQPKNAEHPFERR